MDVDHLESTETGDEMFWAYTFRFGVRLYSAACCASFCNWAEIETAAMHCLKNFHRLKSTAFELG